MRRGGAAGAGTRHAPDGDCLRLGAGRRSSQRERRGSRRALLRDLPGSGPGAASRAAEAGRGVGVGRAPRSLVASDPRPALVAPPSPDRRPDHTDMVGRSEERLRFALEMRAGRSRCRPWSARPAAPTVPAGCSPRRSGPRALLDPDAVAVPREAPPIPHGEGLPELVGGRVYRVGAGAGDPSDGGRARPSAARANAALAHARRQRVRRRARPRRGRGPRRPRWRSAACRRRRPSRRRS